MAVAFPSGVHIDPARSRMRQDEGFDRDLSSANTPRLAKRRRSRALFDITLHGLTTAKYDEVLTFLETNRARTDIELLFDDLLVVGQIPGVIDRNHITDNFRELAFMLIAKPTDITYIPPPVPPVVATSVWDDSDTWVDAETWADT